MNTKNTKRNWIVVVLGVMLATVGIILATLPANGVHAAIVKDAVHRVVRVSGQDKPDAKHGVDIPWWVTTPCKTEDSVNCRWNAKTQGNGKGHTYIVRQFPGKAHMVCVMYAQRKYARTHDYCEAISGPRA